MADEHVESPSESPIEVVKPSENTSRETSTFNIVEPNYNDGKPVKRSIPRRVWDSFQRDPKAHATPVGTLGANGKIFDLEGAAKATATTTLARKLKGRHLQMIAIGGSIGKGHLPRTMGCY